MKTTHYHNTTELVDEELSKAIAKAITQDEKVLTFFQAHSLEEFTPSQVHEAVFDDNVPITSVRRALSNLTRIGKSKRK